MSSAPCGYAVVTPARNETQRLPVLAEALNAQSTQPVSWWIVENGSADHTWETCQRLAEQYDFVRPLQIPEAPAAPDRGAPVVRALHAGIEKARSADVVLKLDADVGPQPDYGSRLLAAFAENPRLGVASGTCLEEHDGVWREQHMTGDMVWCAARAWRTSCLDALLPFEEAFGWDTIDIVKARLAGWETRLFRDVAFHHHRTEGERDGSVQGWISEGRGSHFLGYRPSYLVARALANGRRDWRAIGMIWGFWHAWLTRRPRFHDPGVRRYIREEQRLRFLLRRWRESQGRGDQTAEVERQASSTLS